MTVRLHPSASLILVLLCVAGLGAAKDSYLSQEDRMAAIRHAQVWMPTDIPSLDIKAGPPDAGAFTPGQTVACDFSTKKSSGKTPKFWCAIVPEDVVKVKYGENNGEVYGEVAATRLLWALGFGADRVYPVNVVCRGCSSDPFEDAKPQPGERVFDPAVLERPISAQPLESKSDSGWIWAELDNVDQTNGGAPLAHRHALKLIAVFMQHTDNKAAQQRLVCLDEGASAGGPCSKPFMMLNDVGRTFGKANAFNKDRPGSVDLEAWSGEPIWKGKKGCTANLSRSWTGSLEYPIISEDGRKFLADLLMQLSDQQIQDLFEVARFTRREPGTTVNDWVAAFKQKRDEIATRSCAS